MVAWKKLNSTTDEKQMDFVFICNGLQQNLMNSSLMAGEI